MTDKKTALFLVLDGWGKSPENYPKDQDAIQLADTPYWDGLLEKYPNTLLHTSGEAVGLPPGIMGNSEVGHMNLGAGRIVYQTVVRIDKAIEQDGLKSNEALSGAIEKAKGSGAQLHLMGLVSDAGVHSIDRHYYAILRLAKAMGMPAERVFVHAFTDGRDTPPKSGKGYVAELEETMHKEGLGAIATVSGRYYAMDRDKRWDRTELAYEALVEGRSDFHAQSGVEAVEAAYGRDETDEFIKPTVIVSEPGQPLARIQDGDQLVFFNFRPDRGRQLSRAFVEEGFDGFQTRENLQVELTTMTEYIKGLNARVAFPPEQMSKTMGEVVSAAGKTQLRIAETEKYAHVTFFFNGGREDEFEGEERILVPSPKVATYDLQPEMSLPEVSDKLRGAIESGKYDLIVANFANGDMVGHSGVKEAVVKAAEAVDAALKKCIEPLVERGGVALICADHGNAENLWNLDEDCPHTQHTTTPTPCIVIAPERGDFKLREGGCLADCAPTLLQLMGVDQPAEMTGKSLLAE